MHTQAHSTVHKLLPCHQASFDSIYEHINASIDIQTYSVLDSETNILKPRAIMKRKERRKNSYRE